jgi:predicted PurR-regulated permease PerM
MEKQFKKLIIAGSILALIILSLIVVWPILISIITGLLLAYILSPLYNFAFKFIKEKNISAVIIVLLLIFLLFIPIWFLFPIVTRQIFDSYTYSQKIGFSAIIGKILPEALSTDTTAMINSFISKIVNLIFSSFSDSLLNIPNLLLQIAVILLVFFFAMRDADKLKKYIKDISPFSKSLEENLEKQFRDITNSVVYGHIVLGIIQGILTGIALFILGIQNALLLTIIAIFAAIIPILGAWLVWVPVVIYLFISGRTGAAIFLLLYGSILVSWIDNLLLPYIVSRKANVSSAVVLVGMLGGLFVFGILGLILGPLILSYLVILLDAYKNKKLAEFFSYD